MSTSSTTYGGRYEVIERAGVGGMAEVYRARDELLGREVAVKVLSERLSRDRAFVERFRREAQSAANLNHPNIVSLYDYGADEGTYFIVMEYIDGRPLDDIIRADGALMPERAAEIAADVAQALQRAHGAGLVHRDIKPSNILIATTGQTKVTDFGIARALARDGEQTMTQTGMVIGTAAYLSPEQAQGDPVDARSDVYSLGCVLYEMLTARAPFTGDTPLSIAYKHVREEPSPPSRVNSDVPDELDAIVMKAMAKNPDNRYDGALDMKQDLDRFLGGQGVHATPLLAGDTTVAPGAGSTQVMQREAYEPHRRRRSGPILLVVLGVLALLGALGWLLFSNLTDSVPQVRVPDVVGRQLEVAQDTLEQEGFGVEFERRNDRAPVDQVIQQDPEARDLVDEGSTVVLTISKGLRQVSVPDLSGMTQREASRNLEDHKLELGSVNREASDEVEEGRVLSQSPPPDDEVDAGSSVAITLSTGPELVEVPQVEGLPEEQAIGLLQGLGLGVDVNREPNPDVDEGVVVAQEPAAGTEVAPEDVVSILVSEGPEDFELPDVGGQDADEAEAQLTELGLSVSQEESEEGCAQPPDTVCDTDPDAGTSVGEGDEVVLEVQGGE
ncbi:MAG: Stk1 family PASTA domain-containing Ser/Thr kinase [Actinomycetota bacterium]